MNGKRSTALLGLAFVVLLGLAYTENLFFFRIVSDVLQNQFLAVAVLFLHNVLVVSLILLGMTFYVNLVVLNFFKREKHADVVLTHPRSFAIIFAGMIVFLSILRGATLINGGVTFDTLPLVLLVSAPVGLIEGYGIYLTLKRTFSRTMSMRTLAYINGVFFVASIVEVEFINLLITFVT